MFLFQSWDLRDASADRREILQCGQYLARFCNASPKLWGLSPKNFGGPKTCKIWPDFGRLQSSATYISETNEGIRNRWRVLSTAIPSALGETSSVIFGPVTLEISMLNCTQLRRLFQKTIFWPLGGATLQIFTRARKWPSLTSEFSTKNGAPLQFFFKGDQNWLKM